MAINDAYHVTADALANGSSMIVDGGDAETGAAEVKELSGTGSANVYRETDIDGDGTFEISIRIDAPTGTWHSQGNALTISTSKNQRIRVENTSGAAADYYATGFEVDN